MSPIATSPVIVHTGTQKPVDIIEVKPSKEELIKGKLNDENIELFLSGMHRDGCVVLKDVIDPDHLDVLYEFMVKDALVEVQKPDHHKNFGVAENIQQGPPIHDNYFFDDVYLNKILFQGINLYLGSQAKFDFIQGNTALPNAETRQPAHSDAMGEHPPCPSYVIANIPTCTTSSENGGTELWLGGTHHYTSEHQIRYTASGATKIRDEVREERARIQPGVQPVITKGSILVRDNRVWHAGMPNKSDKIRPMIGLGFCASWRQRSLRFLIPEDQGLQEKFYHGTKDSGIIPMMKEVSFEDYDRLRNSHGYYFAKKK